MSDIDLLIGQRTSSTLAPGALSAGGKRLTSLPMDSESRLARACALGFRTDLSQRRWSSQ